MEEKNFLIKPEIYDLQVDWKKRLEKEKRFFLKIIREKEIERALDIGCGTGHHVEFLAGYIPEVIGIDPSDVSIDYAGKKIIKSKNTHLLKGEFKDLNNLDIGKFDLIISLGNTLPLAKTRRKIKSALKHMKKKLNKDGILVLQFLNFRKKMIEDNNYYKPKSVKYGKDIYILLKHFEYGRVQTRFDFLTTVLNRNGEVKNFFKKTSFLCTLRKNLFLKMANNAGYKKIKLFGPSGYKEFNEKKDISLIALLQKN